MNNSCINTLLFTKKYIIHSICDIWHTTNTISQLSRFKHLCIIQNNAMSYIICVQIFHSWMYNSYRCHDTFIFIFSAEFEYHQLQAHRAFLRKKIIYIKGTKKKQINKNRRMYIVYGGVQSFLIYNTKVKRCLIRTLIYYISYIYKKKGFSSR